MICTNCGSIFNEIDKKRHSCLMEPLIGKELLHDGSTLTYKDEV